MNTTLASLSRNWLEQTWDYRPSAFWFWNADMDPDEMAAIVEEMSANSIREFLIHPVHGMEIEYLSSEFFDRYRYALQLAKKHGMRVWVYDEYGWPSGVAGGKLLREHPEHKGWMLEFHRDEAGKMSAEPIQSDRILDNTMGAPWTHSEAGYLDTLSVDSVRCFIKLTHERILHECGELFNEVIAGFFTDEPVTMVDRASEIAGGWSAVGVPWTPHLPARFAERFGYDIEQRYAELAQSGPSPVKRDYWQLVKEMHVEAYHGQIARWCRDHAVKYTGHVGEDLLLMQLRFTGSIFQSLGEMDEPGIDFLGHGPDPEDRFIEEVVVPSVARHAGKDRVYCEAYGITPFDIRLGKMLRRAQMMGIHGINDIALMGFHQALDGIRKRTYWPPIFREAPWWSFYPQFRDAFARSVGLTSLGERRARYAILYPQEHLEQADPFITPGGDTDPAGPTIEALCKAIYAAGETFEFVFPEILDQACVENGSIVFPHATYDAVLAPTELAVSPESASLLDRLRGAGGQVLRESLEQIEAWVNHNEPSWSDCISIETATPGDIRIFEFGFGDGRLFALRNVTDLGVGVRLSSPLHLAEWDATEGLVKEIPDIADVGVPARTCRFFSVTDVPVGSVDKDTSIETLCLDARWSVSTDLPNMASLSGMRFLHAEHGWIEGEARCLWGFKDGRIKTLVPKQFAGYCEIPFRGEFTCDGVPETMGVLFEGAHLTSLKVNETNVDIKEAKAMAAWDKSCRFVDAKVFVRDGVNAVEGVLKFQEFETSIVNHSFFAFGPMPTCDLCLAGSFRLIQDTLVPESGAPVSLPLDLSTTGWEQYSGVLTLSAAVEVPQGARGIEVELAAEDCVELQIDGVTIGKRITSPYRFEAPDVSPGRHDISLRVSSTSANILDEPSLWGVNSVSWIK
jgi:hypothetical protein